MKGLSVKLIQSALILLPFDLVHEGAVFDRSALINPRNEDWRILKKIIREDRKEKKRKASKQGQWAVGATTGDLELGTKHLDSMTAWIITRDRSFLTGVSAL